MAHEQLVRFSSVTPVMFVIDVSLPSSRNGSFGVPVPPFVALSHKTTKLQSWFREKVVLTVSVFCHLGLVGHSLSPGFTERSGFLLN